VNACITQTLQFGDVEDPGSNVAQLIAENRHFRMHEELGTGPGFYYLWDAKESAPSLPPGRPKEGDVPLGGTARSAREHQ
jgi:Fe-S-cluster-containing dehydrogenase component